MSLVDIAQGMADSDAHDVAVHLLSNVPGLPPIVQTVHLLAVAAVMGSIVMLSLRALGVIGRSQQLDEMTLRLTPWFWCALPVLFASGALFVLARPERYFANPVAGYKFTALAAAIVLAVVMMRRSKREDAAESWTLKALAALTLIVWVSIVLAGRWIAYADYLFAY